MLGPCFVIQYFVYFYFCNHLDGDWRAYCFTLTAFLISCRSQCSVTLPCIAVGWSACVNEVFPDQTYLLF